MAINLSTSQDRSTRSIVLVIVIMRHNGCKRLDYLSITGNTLVLLARVFSLKYR